MDTNLARLQTVTPAPGESFADCLLTGLPRTPKEIACKYFYDAAGSHLFDAICELPEYYQTRTEVALLARHAPEIAALMGPDVEILEYGAGSLRKVRILLDAAQNPYAYTPLDISGDYLQEVVRALAADYPALVLRPVVGDFTGPLEIPDLPGRNAKTSRRAGFFPGSTIGNFKPDAAMALLRRMRANLNGGGLLIRSGFLRKGTPCGCMPPITMRLVSPPCSTRICWHAPIASWGRISTSTPSPITRRTPPRRTVSRCILSA